MCTEKSAYSDSHRKVSMSTGLFWKHQVRIGACSWHVRKLILKRLHPHSNTQFWKWSLTCTSVLFWKVMPLIILRTNTYLRPPTSQILYYCKKEVKGRGAWKQIHSQKKRKNACGDRVFLAVWIRQHFGTRGRQKHHQIWTDDLKIVRDASAGQISYTEWTKVPPRQGKKDWRSDRNRLHTNWCSLQNHIALWHISRFSSPNDLQIWNPVAPCTSLLFGRKGIGNLQMSGFSTTNWSQCHQHLHESKLHSSRVRYLQEEFYQPLVVQNNSVKAKERLQLS